MQMQLEVQELPGKKACIVSVHGQVHLLEAKELEQRLEGILQDDHPHLILDMTDVNFIASDGLGVLIKIRGDARRAGGSVRIVEPPEPVLGVFRTTRLTKLFDIYTSRDEAVADL
jgi:anti-anti-sigma factor